MAQGSIALVTILSVGEIEGETVDIKLSTYHGCYVIILYVAVVKRDLKGPVSQI